MLDRLTKTSGDSERVTVTLSGDVATEPFVGITSPENQDVTTDPVTIVGEVQPVGLSSLKVIIKALGVQSYWNGTAWQNQRTELDVDNLSGQTWSCVLNQPDNEVVDVVSVLMSCVCMCRACQA